MGGSAENSSFLTVARSLLLDRGAAEAVEHLKARGIPCILLKGAAIATWLYDDGMARPYLDIDLLVSPAQFEIATQALGEVGYERRLAGADPSELGAKELDLVGPEGICIDLHHGLLGATGPDQQNWDRLATRTIPLILAAGTQVQVLDIPARAMHLALHAAQNGPVDEKAVADLERGLSRVSREEWREAARLADQIGAAEAFAAGLRLVAQGEFLAEDLALTRHMSVELALRVRSAPQHSLFFERLAQTQGLRRKSILFARRLFPTGATLKANSALARRGPFGLVLARATHPFSIAGHLVPALRAWQDARYSVRSFGGGPDTAPVEPSQFWTGYQPGFRFARAEVGTRAFYDEVTAQRYQLEPHIPDVVQFERWSECDVLEAGCGMATDGSRFAAAGARYTGVDFSRSAPTLAQRRFRLQQLPGRFVAGSVTALPFSDESFDLVFSHGVIHHVHDTDGAIREFERVLRPGATALVMVYHRRSLNYYFTIMTVRRALVALLLIPGSVKVVSRLTGEPEDVLAGHRALLSEMGFRYIRDRELFLSHNTDGPGNPLAKVYSRRELEKAFRAANFVTARTTVRYLHTRLYPGGMWFARTRLGIWLERRIGWHVYVEARKAGTPAS